MGNVFNRGLTFGATVNIYVRLKADNTFLKVCFPPKLLVSSR